MSRYIYSNLFKMISTSILMIIFIPSIISFGCSLVIERITNWTSLILAISCVCLWMIVQLIVISLNKFSRNRIIFEEGRVIYKEKTIYADFISMKYFKFSLSIIEPNLVIPKLFLKLNDLSMTCYLSKKDVEKIKEMNFKIKEI